jgi:prephenate dehydratase
MKKQRVAFQGAKGAFSQQAIHQFLGDKVEAVPCQRFDEVFKMVADGKADAAAIPLENTLHGSVHENYDHLLQFNLPIVAETSVRIVHNLIAMPGVPFRKIRRVFTHPVALNQCLDFFAKNPQIEKVPFYDTAGSVEMVMKEKLEDAAGIASALSADIYGGHILKRSIEDDRQNFTRFVLLRKKDTPRKFDAKGDRKGWKTSLVFSTRNVPGSLFRALSAFALRDINLDKIESRPLRGKPWEYLFYVDFLAQIEDPNVENAFRHLQEIADLLKVLGCYRRGA